MDLAEKPRADAKLKTLPDDRQDDIAEYARDHTLADTVLWLGSSGIQVSSSTLSAFLSWYQVRAQLTQNNSAVHEVLTQIAKQDPEMTVERITELGQKFFIGLAIEKRDPRAWFLVQQIACRQAELQLELQRYRDLIQTRKEAIQRTLDAAKSGGLTPETIEKIEHELNLF